MTRPVVTESPAESARFGLRVGRCEVDGAGDVALLGASLAPFDLVVLRYPAASVTVAFESTQLAGYLCFTADHLCYWEWHGDEIEAEARGEARVPAGWRVDHQPPVDDVVEIVRASFASYSNHYRANPLLDRDAALEGYCEWAALLAGVDGSAFVLRDDLDEGIGVVLVDWSVDLPEIKLAGMRPSAQGRGLYGLLLRSVMDVAAAHGRSGLQISTQSHNVTVMRAWARAGFVPARTVATLHLLRPELAPERASPASPER